MRIISKVYFLNYKCLIIFIEFFNYTAIRRLIALNFYKTFLKWKISTSRTTFVIPIIHISNTFCFKLILNIFCTGMQYTHIHILYVLHHSMLIHICRILIKKVFFLFFLFSCWACSTCMMLCVYKCKLTVIFLKNLFAYNIKKRQQQKRNSKILLNNSTEFYHIPLKILRLVGVIYEIAYTGRKLNWHW